MDCLPRGQTVPKNITREIEVEFAFDKVAYMGTFN